MTLRAVWLSAAVLGFAWVGSGLAPITVEAQLAVMVPAAIVAVVCMRRRPDRPVR